MVPYSVESYEILNNEIEHYYSIGRYEIVLEKLSELISYEPNNGAAHYLMANCLFALDKYDDAIECCKEAILNNFSQDKGNYLLGKIYMEIDKYVKAEDCFLASLRINPQNIESMANYGYLMFRTAHEEKALNIFKEALNIDPNNTTLLHYIFLYHLVKNNKNEKLLVLGQYINNSNNEIGNFVHSGLLDLFDNNYKSARENFRQAFLLNPADKNILNILEDIDRDSHILFVPQRIIRKIGGPAVFWIVSIIICQVLYKLKFSSISTIFLILYILLCIYTWITPFLYRVVIKKNNF